MDITLYPMENVKLNVKEDLNIRLDVILKVIETIIICTSENAAVFNARDEIYCASKILHHSPKCYSFSNTYGI